MRFFSTIYRLLFVPMQALRYGVRRIAYRQLAGGPVRPLSTSGGKEPFLMVASIGNPEPEYKGSRHSVGHFVLDQLVANHWKHFKEFLKHRNISKGTYSVSETDEHSNIFLFKSNETYMNLQGDPIFTNWKNVQKIQLQKYNPSLVVIHDEIQVPLGKIQIRRPGTSPRGHNGLRSIDGVLGQTYTKIAVGIGKPPNKYVADYVLSKFKRPETEVLIYDVVPQIVKALEDMLATP